MKNRLTLPKITCRSYIHKAYTKVHAIQPFQTEGIKEKVNFHIHQGQ